MEEYRVGKNDKNHPIWLYFTAEAIMMKIIGRIGKPPVPINQK